MSRIQIHSDKEVPEYFANTENFANKFFSDLFWACSVVFSHKKKEEYRDLNEIHLALCDFIDFDKNPILQKLIFMLRDSLKSTIMKGFVVQQFCKASYYDYPLKTGISTRGDELSEHHLDYITNEILSNEILQAYFAGYLPKSKQDAESWSQKKVRFRGIEIDIGSVEKSLTGHHYDILINDNFCDEKNTTTSTLRRKVVDRWRQQESIIKEGAKELVFETPWESDDLSGVILDPDGDFNYEKNSKISPNIFVSKTGYAVFSCFAKNKKGELNFPERLNEKYLERKRIKQGKHIYSKMYLGILIPPEDRGIERRWIKDNYYEKLPYNYIRNLVVDCSGTTAKQSTPSAISLLDTDEHGVGYIAYAEKRKVSLLGLEEWLYEVIEKSEEVDKRPITFIGVEKEKFGIALCAILHKANVQRRLWLIDIRGRPRKIRIQPVITALEFGKLRSRKGREFKQYEDEAYEYYEDNPKDFGILDTLAYQLEIQLIPQKVEEHPEVKREKDPLLRELRERNMELINIARTF